MNFVKGMDLSTLAELEKCGAKYYDNGEEKDLLEIMKSYDVDTIRIRVWNDPWSGPENLTVPGKMIQRHRLKSQNV